MSLTMLLRNPEGLIMATDSRVTVGYTLKGPETRDDSVKFIQLARDVGVMTHGIFDIGTRGINALKAGVSSNGSQEISIAEIIEKCKKTFKETSDEWMGENPGIKRRDRDIGFIIAGLDRQKMQFEVYAFESPDFTAKKITGNFFLAGQWYIARFLLSKLDAGKITINTLKNLAAVIIIATTEVDKTVGGPIRLATITKSKGFQWVSEEEMKNISGFNGSFRSFFQELLQSSLTAVLNTEQS